MNLAAQLRAAAWRENLAGYRDRPLPAGAREGAFNQLDLPDGPDEDPVKTLEAILGAPVPDHLAAELDSAREGLALARDRAAARNRHFAAMAARSGAGTLAELVAACTRDPHTVTRLLETLATDGHQLHPCARTRLGWDHRDRERYDLETTRPIRVRLIADHAGVLERSGDDFRDHPMLRGLDLPDPVLPVHPWQLEHRVLPEHRDLFDTGRLEVLEATVPAWPTAAIRTLAGHDAPGFLKLALGIHITSTRRDISPATALLGPRLSALIGQIHRIGGNGTTTQHRLVWDTAGAWLPGSRALTALARSPLPASGDGTVVVPATALAATSPVTGLSLAAEYAHWSGDADAWLRRYAALFTGPVLNLAEMGIGLEAHLQNCLVAMRGPEPVYPVTRDLGGARIHLPTLRPWALELPPGSPVDADSMDQVRAKVAYTLLQNHFAALVHVLERDLGLDPAAFWADLADQIAARAPAAARDAYLAPQQATKALLTMRLHPGQEVESMVDNPLAPVDASLHEAVRALPSPSSAWIHRPGVLVERLAALRSALEGHVILYAMKASANPAILAAAVAHADGIECASGGEFAAARAAGAARLAFSGPAKTPADFAAAAACEAPLTMHAESRRELDGLAAAGYTGPVALRVNRGPALPGTHQMTGAPTPFGFDEHETAAAVAHALALGLDVAGFHLHAVSNCLDAAAYAAHVRGAVAWSRSAAAGRFDLRYINVGGGLGADPRGDLIDLDALQAGLRGLDTGGAELVFEPGRYLAAAAGWYVAEVLDLKTVQGQAFALVRGGTHHFRLPAAWGYAHPFTVVPGPRTGPVWSDVEVRVCGELCTPRDVLNGGQRVDRIAVGDRLVFANAGAYGWEISHDRFLGHAGPTHVVIR